MGILGFSGLYTMGESVPVVIDDFKPVEGDSSDASIQSDSSGDFEQSVQVIPGTEIEGGKSLCLSG